MQGVQMQMGSMQVGSAQGMVGARSAMPMQQGMGGMGMMGMGAGMSSGMASNPGLGMGAASAPSTFVRAFLQGGRALRSCGSAVHLPHFAEKLGSTPTSSSSSKDNDPFGAFSIKK